MRDSHCHWSCPIEVFLSIPPAPSAAPTSVNVSDVTSSTITVQWGTIVNCTDRNGDITGYSVQYGVQGSGSTQTRDVSGGDTRQTTISGLSPSTNYSIEVAAVNSAGIGEYSTSVIIQTAGEQSVIVVYQSRIMYTCTCVQVRNTCACRLSTCYILKRLQCFGLLSHFVVVTLCCSAPV